jgi:hypothetical protein
MLPDVRPLANIRQQGMSKYLAAAGQKPSAVVTA